MTDVLLPRRMFLHEFEPLVGQTFYADCNPRMAPLKLESATPVHVTGPIIAPQFTLIFSSAAAVFLVAGSYSLRCGLFGPAMIDLSPTFAPIGEVSDRHYYQAPFS